MPYTRRENYPEDGTDTIRIGPNVYWNESLYRFDTLDHNKDVFVIDIIGSLDGDGYISIKHAPATTGEPDFTELIKITPDGILEMIKGYVKV